MNTRQVDEYLKRLKRHRQHLEDMLEERDEEKSHRFRAELVALNWTIRYIEDTILQAAEHQYKWFIENGEKNSEIHSNSRSASSAIR